MCVVAQEAEANLHELQQEGPWDRTWSAKLGNKVPLPIQQPPKLFLQSLSWLVSPALSNPNNIKC